MRAYTSVRYISPDLHSISLSPRLRVPPFLVRGCTRGVQQSCRHGCRHVATGGVWVSLPRAGHRPCQLAGTASIHRSPSPHCREVPDTCPSAFRRGHRLRRLLWLSAPRRRRLAALDRGTRATGALPAGLGRIAVACRAPIVAVPMHFSQTSSSRSTFFFTGHDAQ